MPSATRQLIRQSTSSVSGPFQGQPCTATWSSLSCATSKTSTTYSA